MINERKLTKAELKKREDIIMNMKDNKRDLVKKYGKDAEAVMYGRATNMAKKQTKEMRDPKITELIKDALKNPKKADLNKDGKLSDYEKTRGKAIEKAIAKEDLESGQYGDPKVGNYDITSQNDNEAGDIEALAAAGLEEDLDLGHEDNEPHMLKADLYRIGKYAMELYKMVDNFDGEGEVDFPSWWQSKIFKAKDSLVGAKHYLDFELKEPQIDAVVDVATDVVNDDSIEVVDDVEIGETVEDYITSVDDLTEENITENMNYNKWRRAFNGKNFAVKTILLEDYMDNKKRYAIRFKYNETPRADVVSVSEVHFGGHEGSGMPFSLSNMQTKPTKLFSPDDKFEFDDEEEFEKFLQEGSKGLENLLSFFLGGKFADDAIEDHLETGVYKIVKIKEAEYLPAAAVNEQTNQGSNDNSNDGSNDNSNLNSNGIVSRVAERLAKELKEGLPKGFWDKKIDAKDEDQDGKVDEAMAVFSSDKDEDKYIEKMVAKTLAKEKAAKAKDKKVNEDYDSLVKKIKKQGKSEKAAKAIAGAVASYKAKGGGKGPTAKQK